MSSPILQYLDTPTALAPSDYRNAYSLANTRGDYRTAYNLRSLLDPVPSLTQGYYPSTASIELNYGMVIEGASASSPSMFSSRLIASAQEAFESSALVNLGGTPGTWRALSAEPADWMDADESQFRPATIDPTTLKISGLSIEPLQLTAGGVRENWKLRVDGQACALSSSSTVSPIQVSILEVFVSRSWLNTTLFESGGWFLRGEPSGFVSSGSLAKNEGILPLITTGFVVARGPELDLALGAQERAFVANRASARSQASLGPLPLHISGLVSPAPSQASAGVNDALYLLAVFSELQPLAPQIAG